MTERRPVVGEIIIFSAFLKRYCRDTGTVSKSASNLERQHEAVAARVTEEYGFVARQTPISPLTVDQVLMKVEATIAHVKL